MVKNQLWKDLKGTQQPESVLYFDIINQWLDDREEGNVRWNIRITQDTSSLKRHMNQDKLMTKLLFLIILILITVTNLAFKAELPPQPSRIWGGPNTDKTDAQAELQQGLEAPPVGPLKDHSRTGAWALAWGQTLSPWAQLPWQLGAAPQSAGTPAQPDFTACTPGGQQTPLD